MTEEYIRMSDAVRVLTNNGVHFCDLVKMTSEMKALEILKAKPCEDCISRETFSEIFDEAIHKSYDWAEKYPEYRGIILSGMQYTLDIFKQVFNLPSVTPKIWHPVTERLPEEGTWVFITFVDELSSGISIAYYSGNSWHGNIEKYDTVTAWMPLPELYKKGESE